MKKYDDAYKNYGKANGGSDAYVNKHNNMYKPKSMSLKDGKIAPMSYKCEGAKTIFPKNEKM